MTGDRTPTHSEVLTALELERRRRGLHDLNELDRVTTYSEREEIVKAYVDQKQKKMERKRQQCSGCSWRCGTDRSCSFFLTGRLRRKDAEGMCLEYTKEKRRRKPGEQ